MLYLDIELIMCVVCSPLVEVLDDLAICVGVCLGGVGDLVIVLTVCSGGVSTVPAMYISVGIG